MNTSEIPAEDLAGAPLDASDAIVLSMLADLYDLIDPVPSDLVDRLQFSITLDALNAELAELQQMSGPTLAFRGEQASAVNTLTFTSDSLTTLVAISPDGPDRIRIDGWAAPGAGAVVELHQGSLTRRVSADADGRFVFEDVAHGLTRFVVNAADPGAHPPVMTPAVEI
ncbi:MAG: carboxypeptidase regulatory-like domain-containing protein [Jatrophihabitantaceae bacterium]